MAPGLSGSSQAHRRLRILLGHTADTDATVYPLPPWTACSCNSRKQQEEGLTEEERYFFDVYGWVVVPSVLNAAQITACNAAIERNRGQVKYTPLSAGYPGAPLRPWVVPRSLAGSSKYPGRSQLPNTMCLAAPHRRIFREIFVLGKTLGCMQDLIGNGFCGSEGRVLLTQTGAEGHALHSGGTTRDADEEASTLSLGGNMSLYHNGRLWNTVMSCQYALTDVPPETSPPPDYVLRTDETSKKTTSKTHRDASFNSME